MIFTVIGILIVVSALLTLAETAVASSKGARLEQAAREGSRTARSALKLLQTPRRLLVAVRLLLLLSAVLAGAIAQASLSGTVAQVLIRWGVPAGLAGGLGTAAVVVGVTTLLVLIGELMPRRLGLLFPEPIAIFLARPMRLLAALTSPFTAFLDAFAELILRVFGIRGTLEQTVTHEEIRVLIEQGAKAGLFEKTEHDIMTNVFRLGDRRASSLMTPRTEIVWLKADAPEEDVRRILAENPHSNFPVGQETLDNVVGILSAKDCLARAIVGRPVIVAELVRKPLIVPEGVSMLQLLERFRESPQQMALIADEYGSILGMVSQNHVLEALVGDLPSPEEPGEMPMAVRRDDGSWLVDAAMSADELKDLMKLRALPGESDYDTVGGFVLMQLQRIPKAADWFEWNGMRFEVVDMDGKRIDKLLIQGRPSTESRFDED